MLSFNKKDNSKIIFIISIIFYFLLYIESSSAITLTSCNQSLPSGIHNFGSNISANMHNCFFLLNDNLELNCQGYTLNVNGYDYGINIASDNVTVKNCRVTGQILNTGAAIYSSGMTQLKLINITAYNNDYATLLLGSYVTVNNSNFSNNDYGLYLRASNSQVNNVITNNNAVRGTYLRFHSFVNINNLTSTNNPEGLRFYSNVAYINISNSNISSNTNYNIHYFASSGNEIKFQNNYLGNWSKIYSDNWPNTATYFYDNIYLQGTQLYDCFDHNITPANQSCETNAPSIISQTTSPSVFSLQNFTSTFLTLLSIIFFFILN